jgi:adenylosuccinate synthase
LIASGDDYLIGKAIRLRGVEYGTTTGRPRRVGYPDFVMLLHSRDINSIQSWAITKMDVLGDIEFRVATKYVNEDGILVPEYSGKKYGWETIGEEDKERMVRDGFDSMHEGMKEYLIDLANFTKTPVSFGSISPERRRTVTRKVLERTSEYL